jgi:hypothetical protein
MSRRWGDGGAPVRPQRREVRLYDPAEKMPRRVIGRQPRSIRESSELALAPLSQLAARTPRKVRKIAPWTQKVSTT